MIELISLVSQVYHYAGNKRGFESKLDHVEPAWTGRLHLSLFSWDNTDIFPEGLEVKYSKHAKNEIWKFWKEMEEMKIPQ